MSHAIAFLSSTGECDATAVSYSRDVYREDHHDDHPEHRRNPPRPLYLAQSAQYSQGAKAGDLVFTSGQAGYDDAGNLVDGGFEAQARQVFRNIEKILHQHGASMSSVVKLTAYLATATTSTHSRRSAPNSSPALARGDRGTELVPRRGHALRSGRRRRRRCPAGTRGHRRQLAAGRHPDLSTTSTELGFHV